MTLTILAFLVIANMSMAWRNVHRKEPNKLYKRMDLVLAYLLIIGGVAGLIQALNELFKFNF